MSPHPTLLLHQKELIVGTCFLYTTFFPAFRTSKGEWVSERIRGNKFSTWEVLRIEERGIVVGHPLHGRCGNPGSHEHFLEWNTPLSSFQLS